jgi:hypothetical protein
MLAKMSPIPITKNRISSTRLFMHSRKRAMCETLRMPTEESQNVIDGVAILYHSVQTTGGMDIAATVAVMRHMS